MPPRSRGHGTHGDEPDDGEPSRPHASSGGHRSMLDQEGAAAEVLRAGRWTENGGTGPQAQAQDLLTQRTGGFGDVPTGRPTHVEPDADTEPRRSLELENSGALAIARRGYQIHQNPTKAEVAQA